jgi:hypothetical protein
MKISQVRELTIGSIVANKVTHFKIANINMQDGKIVSFDLEAMEGHVNTSGLNRTIKLDSMRKYELIKLAEKEIPNYIVKPQLCLPAPVEEKPVLHVDKKESKSAKTDNDTLLNALREHLEGAKKSEVCKKYNIPSYIFSRILNFKHGRPSLRGAVYDLCKEYDKLDIIKHIELYEEA